MRRDWSNLPKELLGIIVKHLTFIHDYVRFSAVCKSWHSVASESVHHLPRQLPFLMIGFHDEGRTESRGFYSLLERRILPIRLPILYERCCRGSTDGWLTTVEDDKSMTLFNPFSKKEIQLPPMTALPNPYGDFPCYFRFLQKAVLSSNPSFTPDYLLMVIYTWRGELAFFRPAGVGWTAIESQHRFFDDVVYYMGKFYAITYSGIVVVFDPVGVGPNPSTVELAANPIPIASLIKSYPEEVDSIQIKRYLVESLGDLLQVVRSFISKIGEEDVLDVCRTFDFEVFKLDLSGGPGRWIKVKSLGDRVLFLGDNASFSVSASDFPGCRGNHIYFTDDLFGRHVMFHDGFYDLGVFNLQNGSVEPLVDPIEGEMPPPIWISPTFCNIIELECKLSM